MGTFPSGREEYHGRETRCLVLQYDLAVCEKGIIIEMSGRMKEKKVWYVFISLECLSENVQMSLAVEASAC